MPSTTSSRKKLTQYMLCQITNGSASQFGWLLYCLSVGSEVNLITDWKGVTVCDRWHQITSPPLGQLSISPLPVSVSWTILPVCFCLFMIYVTLFVLWMIISSRELVSQLFLCFHRQLARRTRMIDASCLVLQWFCATLNQSFIYLVAAVLSALLKCGWRKHWMTSWSRVMYIYLIMTCLGKKLLPFIN